MAVSLRVRSTPRCASFLSRSWSRVWARILSVAASREVRPSIFMSSEERSVWWAERSESRCVSRRWRTTCSDMSLVSSSDARWRVGLELGLHLAVAVGEAGQPVILFLGHLLEPLDLVVEKAVPLAGLDQLALGAGNGLVGFLGLEAQGLVFLGDVAGAFGLDRELVFEIDADRLLVLHVEAQVLDRGFLLAELRFGLAQLGHRGGQIVRHAGMGVGRSVSSRRRRAGGIASPAAARPRFRAGATGSADRSG